MSKMRDVLLSLSSACTRNAIYLPSSRFACVSRRSHLGLRVAFFFLIAPLLIDSHQLHLNRPEFFRRCLQLLEIIAAIIKLGTVLCSAAFPIKAQHGKSRKGEIAPAVKNDSDVSLLQIQSASLTLCCSGAAVLHCTNAVVNVP